MDLSTVFEIFPTQEHCLTHIEAARWPDGHVCPYCGGRHSTCVPKERRHHCNRCNTSYSATVGTIFHRTHLPLQKWLLALVLALRENAGLSARHLARELGVSKDTALRVSTRIRAAMADGHQRELLLKLIAIEEYERWRHHKVNTQTDAGDTA